MTEKSCKPLIYRDSYPPAGRSWASDGGMHNWSCVGTGGIAECSAPGLNSTAVGGAGTLTLSVLAGAGCTLAQAVLVAPPPGLPDGTRLLYGALDFTLTGCTAGSATLKITYSGSVAGLEYWKHIKGAWNVMSEATLAGNSATFTLLDNGPYDADPTPGVIHDPSGVGMPAGAGRVSAPTLSQLATWFLGVLLVGVGWSRVRCRA